MPSDDNLEKMLDELPDKISSSLKDWRMMTLEREKCEALLFLKFRAGEKRTVDEIKALVRSDGGRYQAVLNELTAESEYTRLYERLLAAKRRASLRTAY